MEQLIVGNTSISSTFERSVYDSFLDTIVQSMQSHTTDVKEILHIARSLWPSYLQPLSSMDSEPSEKILSVLHRKILPSLRNELEHSLFSLRGNTDNNVHKMSLWSKYLLLSAFLCQVNRADRDKHLFSIEKNGKRQRANTNRDREEDIAFGKRTTQRPKAFPLERMLSVYVSLVGLNQEDELGSLGSVAFFQSLANMRDIGLLHEQPMRTADQPLRLVEPRYWCSLTLEEARTIASGISFPLDRYML
jgi:hypothetical protein